MLDAGFVILVKWANLCTNVANISKRTKKDLFGIDLTAAGWDKR
jgi:hypothetical protein